MHRFKTPVDSLETLVDQLEAGLHLSAQRHEFGPHFNPQRPSLRFDSLETLVDLIKALIYVIER